MTGENFDIFISYRRSDAKERARSINETLKAKHYRCFLDLATLTAGTFENKIKEAIKDAPIFIAVLTPDYFSRVNDEDDWVRKEIECALQEGKIIIPINVDNSFKEYPDGTPESIRENFGAHNYASLHFDASYDACMSDIIQKWIQDKIKKYGGDDAVYTTLEITSDEDCDVYKGGKLMANVQKGKCNFLQLKPGRHRLQFVSCRFSQYQYEEIVEAPNNPYEDFLKVQISANVDAEIQRRYCGYAYVDLGLSVKWATCNVGATQPEGYGEYFAWGETETKTKYTVVNSKTFGKSLSDVSGDARYDVARARWGGSWRMPNRSEIKELNDKCQWQWTTMNGIKGYKVTGPNGNSIFLPAAGYRNGSNLYDVGLGGYYWSSTPGGDDDSGAYYLNFNDKYRLVNWNGRYFGRSVRPVSE